MAQSKSINVKVRTEKVLEALNTALTERKQRIADYEKAEAEYKKAEKEFLNSVAELFRSGKGKTLSVKKAWREDSKYEITVEFPASVKPPVEPEKDYNDWGLKTEIEELENAIALLRMTDEEFVSTSTYKGVARLIK